MNQHSLFEYIFVDSCIQSCYWGVNWKRLATLNSPLNSQHPWCKWVKPSTLLHLKYFPTNFEYLRCKLKTTKSCFATVTQSFSRKPVSQGRDCFLTTTSARHFFLFLPDILSNFITVWGYFLAGRGQVSKLFATTWEKCSLLRPSKSGRQLNSNATQWMKHSYLFKKKYIIKNFRNSCKETGLE